MYNDPIERIMRGGTRRNLSRKTDGKNVAIFAQLLGFKLLPWQQYVADVASEIDPETGSYYYDTVVLSTQRQCGKSTLIDSYDTRNAFWGENRFIYYLAQTGKDAADHFKKYTKILEQSPLKHKARAPYLGMGNMGQPFCNGSVIRPMSVTKVAGHGAQGDKITMDEAFSLSLETGNAIIGGFLPTTATRFKATCVRPQLWICSTEGTQESVFFNEHLDACRTADIPRRTCWFDFGAPQDTDPDDLQTLLHYHPAAGQLWDIEQLADWRAQYGNDTNGFMRGYANIRDTGVQERIFDIDIWNASTTTPLQPADANGARIALGVAVDVDATKTALAVAWRTDNDTIHTQLVNVLDGTGSAPVEIQRLAQTYNATVVMDSRGPGAALCTYLQSLSDDYQQPLVSMLDFPAADYMQVGQFFASGLTNHTIVHASDSVLDDSAASSARAWAGDAWKITRRGSIGSTCPLEACMLAAWGVVRAPEPVGVQVFTF